MPPRKAIFYACVECSGSQGCGRNGRGGLTCSSHPCKAAYKKKRAERPLSSTEGKSNAVALDAVEMLPPGKWIQELEEILGERCCLLRTLNLKKRKNGPGTSYQQQFLVRGKFLEDTADGDDSDADECPEWNTFWMDAADLVQRLFRRQMSRHKAALVVRHKRVLAEL